MIFYFGDLKPFLTSNGSGTLILAELDLTFNRNPIFLVLPILVLKLTILNKCSNTFGISNWFYFYFWAIWYQPIRNQNIKISIHDIFNKTNAFLGFEKYYTDHICVIPSVFNRSWHHSTRIFLQFILYLQPIENKKILLY